MQRDITNRDKIIIKLCKSGLSTVAENPGDNICHAQFAKKRIEIKNIPSKFTKTNATSSTIIYINCQSQQFFRTYLNQFDQLFSTLIK